MKLKFYIKNGKKTYTLESNHDCKETSDAHYKFIKMKDVKDKDYNKVF